MECRGYLEEKYGFDESDYFGMFKDGKINDGVEFASFWHWVCDNFEVNNGSTITFGNWDLGRAEENWQKTILEYYLKEFGEGPDREVTFEVSW